VHAFDDARELFLAAYARQTQDAPVFSERRAFYEAATYFRLLHVVLQRPHFSRHFDALFEMVEEILKNEKNPRP